MYEIYALVIICTIAGDCFELRDNISQYQNLLQCKTELKVLKEKYDTGLVYCKKGDIIKDVNSFENFELI